MNRGLWSHGDKLRHVTATALGLQWPRHRGLLPAPGARGRRGALVHVPGVCPSVATGGRPLGTCLGSGPRVASTPISAVKSCGPFSPRGVAGLQEATGPSLPTPAGAACTPIGRAAWQAAVSVSRPGARTEARACAPSEGGRPRAAAECRTHTAWHTVVRCHLRLPGGGWLVRQGWAADRGPSGHRACSQQTSHPSWRGALTSVRGLSLLTR